MPPPHRRQPLFNVSHAPDLAEAWNDSAARFEQIREAIGDGLPDWIACVAVSGSLARMEAHAHSDLDLIVVIDDRHRSVSAADAELALHRIWEKLDGLAAAPPKSDGIFSVCARWRDLIDPGSKGRIDENLITFGHRIQLLMDAQPVTCEPQFSELQHAILEWYAETRLADAFGEPGPFHWLWQDVHRYWRSLRSRTCWLDADHAAKSLALNVKLRSSRLILVFAFLLTLHESQLAQGSLTDTIERVVRSLRKTPAERLFGHSDAIVGWNTVWDFLRTAAARPVVETSDEIRNAMTQLAGAVTAKIDTAGREGNRQQWLL